MAPVNSGPQAPPRIKKARMPVPQDKPFSLGGTTSWDVAATAGKAMLMEILNRGIITAQKIIRFLLLTSKAASSTRRRKTTAKAVLTAASSIRPPPRFFCHRSARMPPAIGPRRPIMVTDSP